MATLGLTTVFEENIKALQRQAMDNGDDDDGRMATMVTRQTGGTEAGQQLCGSPAATWQVVAWTMT